VYARDGVYTAWLAVRESGSADNFTTLAKTSVKVLDLSNYAPTGVDFTFSPLDPDTGTIVYLNASATDPNGDPMTFSWDFGDGHTAAGTQVTHQFTVGQPSYTVTLSVDDGHLGMGARPVNSSHLVPVTNNTAPSCSVPSYPHVVWKTLTNFSISSVDPDTRDKHRYTWDWGDGSVSVTNTKWAWYSYPRKASYTLTVYADDLTGLPGHNVSGSNNVLVGGTNVAPVLVSFTVTKNNPNVGQVVTFTGTATDADGDWLTYTFDFGDGNTVDLIGLSTPGVPLVLSTDYWYGAQGTYTAYLYVTDGYSVPKTSSPQVMSVVLANRPPVVSPLADKKATSGYGLAFTAAATDPDGDPLMYTWDFGDLTPLVVGSSVMHVYSYEGDFVCRVYVDDGTGFVGYNVSKSAWVQIKDATVALVQGWNFVCVPCVGYGYKASTLGLRTNDIVAGWNPATQAYDKTYVVNVSLPFKDFNIEANTGYWILATAPETLNLIGSFPGGTQSRSITVPGAGSWAVVGFNTLRTDMKASDIVANYTGGSVTQVVSYNATTGQYKTYNPLLPFTNYYLAPGQAYWIMVTATGTLAYSP
jgi:hypothetical protein